MIAFIWTFVQDIFWKIVEFLTAQVHRDVKDFKKKFEKKISYLENEIEALEKENLVSNEKFTELLGKIKVLGVKIKSKDKRCFDDLVTRLHNIQIRIKTLSNNHAQRRVEAEENGLKVRFESNIEVLENEVKSIQMSRKAIMSSKLRLLLQNRKCLQDDIDSKTSNAQWIPPIRKRLINLEQDIFRLDISDDVDPAKRLEQIEKNVKQHKSDVQHQIKILENNLRQYGTRVTEQSLKTLINEVNTIINWISSLAEDTTLLDTEKTQARYLKEAIMTLTVDSGHIEKMVKHTERTEPESRGTLRAIGAGVVGGALMVATGGLINPLTAGALASGGAYLLGSPDSNRKTETTITIVKSNSKAIKMNSFASIGE